MTELREELRALYDELRSKMRNDWSRDLPLEELLFDRWERAQSLGFGEGASIYHNSYVFGDVKVGPKTWIGPFTMLDGSGGLTIGAGCSISSGVHIYTHDTVRWAVSGGQVPAERDAVAIGDYTYLGSQTVVAKGVTIGDHVVVGACSFVNRDIPPYTVAVGVPCRPIGTVEVNENADVRLVYDGRG
ncbi:MAG TPA: acyltransferase [Candidatus Limnocylindria bacterium]|nr:acyltransferase [Candidatus Limnocylindria bacterium]